MLETDIRSVRWGH